jgi:hypothetical protein
MRPGQWYLDRTAGRVVYWPLPGQDMTKAKVIAPILERILSIVGNSILPTPLKLGNSTSPKPSRRFMPLILPCLIHTLPAWTATLEV